MRGSRLIETLRQHCKSYFICMSLNATILDCTSVIIILIDPNISTV